jgi:hypothetical protein
MQRCHLHSLSKADGAITAQHRNAPSEDTGFSFLGCKITGVGTALLGRPWGAYSRVVFSLTYMSSVVVPQGWDDWGDQSKHRYVPSGSILWFTLCITNLILRVIIVPRRGVHTLSNVDMYLQIVDINIYKL